MIAKLKKTVIFAGKTIGLIFLLILAHITITYAVEQLELVSITPLTISDVRDSHIVNILVPFPYLVVRGGWLYFLAFLTYHKAARKIPQKPFWIYLGLGIAVSMVYFLLWWATIEVMDPEVFREGLIVFPLLGIVLTLLHKLFFPKHYVDKESR